MSEVFPCNNCGACCKSVRLSMLTDWLDRGDGFCKYFDEALSVCIIYEKRPEICNVKKMYEKQYKENIEWHKFTILNEKACKELAGEVKKFNL